MSRASVRRWEDCKRRMLPNEVSPQDEVSSQRKSKKATNRLHLERKGRVAKRRAILPLKLKLLLMRGSKSGQEPNKTKDKDKRKDDHEPSKNDNKYRKKK